LARIDNLGTVAERRDVVVEVLALIWHPSRSGFHDLVERQYSV
jgi:hypothetical protein